MKILKRQMKGALSREQAAEFKKFEQKQKQDIAANKMKYIIQSTLGTRNPTPVFNQVETADGWLMDPYQIHRHFTEGWEKRFIQPRNTGVAIAGLEPEVHHDSSDFLPAAAKWEKMLDDPEMLSATLQAGSPVPSVLIDTIARAFSDNPNRLGLEQHLEAAFNADFTEAEMKKLVKSSKSTTPGLTGFSYQMMKLLPEERLTELFQLLNSLWKTRTVPEFWTYKALQGLPKSSKPNPGVGDLRPIGLIEVTRKLWTRMVMSKIFAGMRKFAVLQENQSGGLANRGTDSALLQLLNLLEDGINQEHEGENEGPTNHIDFTSWDTRMAYDSVGNHIQYASWRRLGVPARETRWLMGLDMHGLFVVMTPYARDKLTRLKMAHQSCSAHHHDIRQLGFTPERGLTQGDVKSPLGWIAYFDILIRALNQCHPELYPKYTVEAPEMDTLFPSVYMDDLTSATCCRKHTQQVADLVSAFNAIFGTEAAIQKFRATSTKPGGDPIVIHDGAWAATTKEFDGPQKVIRILGVDINLNYTWEEQIATLKQKFRLIGKALQSSPLDGDAKVKIINMAVITKASYVVGLAAWPPQAVQELDAIITQMARTSLRLSKSYPSAIIHSKRFGFGVLQLSTHADQAKERIQNRCLEGPGPQNNAARGLINRAMCDQLGKPVQGHGETTGEVPEKARYISAICRTGRKRKKRIKRVGRKSAPEVTQVGLHPEVSSQSLGVKNFLRTHGIHYVAECRNWLTGDLAGWISSAVAELPDAEDIRLGLRALIGPDPVPESIPIRRGHLLAFLDGTDQPRFFAVDGYLNREKCLGGVWYQADPDGDGDELERCTQVESQGNCGADRCDLAYVEQSCSGLGFTASDSHSQRRIQIVGTNGTIRIDYLPPPKRQRHRPPVAPWTRTILDAAAAFGRSIDCLTSDGSVELDQIAPTDIWAGPQAFLARRGAIVITDQEWLQGKADGLGPVGVILVEDFPDELEGMSNGVELLCFLCSLQLAWAAYADAHTIPIVETDCNSIIRRGSKEQSRFGTRSLDNRRHGYAYRFIRRVKRLLPGGIQRWLRSHPERRKGIGEYTSSEARIALADAFASRAEPESVLEMLNNPRMRNSKYELQPEHIHRVSAKDILESMFSHGDYCWVDEQDIPLTASLMSAVTDDLQPYILAREGYAATGSGYHWTDSETGMLGHILHKTKKLLTIAERKERIQNLWDKHMHGRNQQKEWKLPEPPNCPLCCLSTDSQAHYALRCPHPYFVRAREGMEHQILSRIKELPQGAGRACLWQLWQWVLHPEDHSCTEREEMARMGFIQGRPLRESLDMCERERWIGKNERLELVQCVTDLWMTVGTYLHRLWTLRGSILAAPLEVQRTLRTHVATPKDVQDLIQRPYYTRQLKGKTNHWLSSLAQFCKHRRHLEPIHEAPSQEALDVRESEPASWDPKWTCWLSRTSTFGKAPSERKKKRKRKQKQTPGGRHHRQLRSDSDPL